MHKFLAGVARLQSNVLSTCCICVEPMPCGRVSVNLSLIGDELTAFILGVYFDNKLAVEGHINEKINKVYVGNN